MSVISNGQLIEGVLVSKEGDAYIYEYVINSSSVKIQNQYNETINHWSVLALYDLEIDYTIK